MSVAIAKMDGYGMSKTKLTTKVNTSIFIPTSSPSRTTTGHIYGNLFMRITASKIHMS